VRPGSRQPPAVGSAHAPAASSAEREEASAIVPASSFGSSQPDCLRYFCLFPPICTCVDLSLTTWVLGLTVAPFQICRDPRRGKTYAHQKRKEGNFLYWGEDSKLDTAILDLQGNSSESSSDEIRPSMDKNRNSKRINDMILQARCSNPSALLALTRARR
jgi:hypothetical protein